jgi:hypothetical protein
MSLPELEQNCVKVYADPAFRVRESAAEWAWRWVLRNVFPYRKSWLPLVRWFTGPPAERLKGGSCKHDPDVLWLSVRLETPEEVIETAAHEAAHALGYDAEEIPSLVGRLAREHWSGENTVYVHHGPLRYDWMPKGLDALPMNAVVLEFDEGEARTYRNRGNPRHASWIRVVIQ